MEIRRRGKTAAPGLQLKFHAMRFCQRCNPPHRGDTATGCCIAAYRRPGIGLERVGDIHFIRDGDPGGQDGNPRA